MSQVIAEKGEDAQWANNSLRFETKEEAEAYVKDLYFRWTLVRKPRAIENGYPVNYNLVNGPAVPLEAE